MSKFVVVFGGGFSVVAVNAAVVAIADVVVGVFAVDVVVFVSVSLYFKNLIPTY